MQTEKKSTTDIDVKKSFKQNDLKYPLQSSSNLLSKPKIASFLLILAGVIAILSWIPFVMGDETLISFAIENLNMNMTQEQIRESFVICGLIEIILAIFLILGGILAFKKKLWGVAIICSIIGLFTIGQFLLASALSLIALILLIISKQEFQKQMD